jgi:hypothetical protein
VTVFLGMTVVLATFAVVASVGTAAVAPWIRRLVSSSAHPARRARLLLAAHAGPVLGALAAAFGLVLPAFAIFEPAHAGERPGTVLLCLAAVGGVLLLASAASVVHAVAFTSHVRRAWLSRAQPVEIAGRTTGALCIDAAFPVVAVIGVARPLLFVARSVVKACSAAELDAIVAHETAHLASRDNMKRLLLRATGSAWTCVPGGDALVAAWTRAVEEAADDRATLDAPGRRVELASALARVARLATMPAPRAAVHASALFTGPVETRIRRLLGTAAGPVDGPTRSRWVRAARLLGAGAAAWGAVALLPLVHSGIEMIVRGLP